MMNRYGWHYPEFTLKAESKKIALIGDSFVEAIQVSPHHNIGIVLKEIFHKAPNDDYSTDVMSLGLSGIGPAQYFELLKYASEYLDINEL